MDRLDRRIEAARAAVKALGEALTLQVPEEVRRDVCILRFVLAVEATWKAARAVLLSREGLDVVSPKAAVRASVRVGAIAPEDAEAAMALVDDRNLTVHVYDAALAVALGARLPGHCALLARWVDALAQPVDDPEPIDR